MADPALISVVLPTHQRLPLLREAVASVRAQTDGRWEMLIVDDGSTDGTAEYLAALAAEEPRVRPILLPHDGNPGRARNAGIAAARGRWIAFLDSDDTWRADKLALQRAAMEANPGLRWLYTGRSLMDGDGRSLSDADYRPWRPVSGDVVLPLLSHEAMIALPSVLAERSLLDEAGGFDESLRYCMDYDLWLRLAARAPTLALPEPLVCIRLHTGSRTRGKLGVNTGFFRVYTRFARRHPTPDVVRICRRQQRFYARWIVRLALRDLLSALRRLVGH